MQIKTKGQVGYSIGKPSSAKNIHPSKQKKAMEATVPRFTLSSSVPPDCFKIIPDPSNNSKDNP